MKNQYIILLFSILCFAQSYTILAENAWGPKINLEISNEKGDKQSNIYFGVDIKATDGYDKDTFDFNGIKIWEYEDMPNFGAPGSIYCAMVKDTTQSSLSYVDMREIPQNTDIFMHKFKMSKFSWGSDNYIKIYWGKLPAGIDSAKFHGAEWMDDDKYIDMKKIESVDTTDIILLNDRHFYITVWYNKNNSGIKEIVANSIKIYPNPASDYIYINNNNLEQYRIIDIYGKALICDNFNFNSKIDISRLEQGTYIIQMFDINGNMYVNKIIKN